MDKTTHEIDGKTVGTNWMLDQVIDTCDRHDSHKDELIKELAIEKIEYGRQCAWHSLYIGFKPSDKELSDMKKFDAELCELIVGLGGTPIEGHPSLRT